MKSRARRGTRTKRAADRRRLQASAYHEGGHAVVAYHLHVPFRSISIIPSEGCLGSVTLRPSRVPAGSDLRLRRWVERRVLTLLAGSMAERLITRRPRPLGAWYDYALAVRFSGLVCATPEETNPYLRWLRARTAAILQRLPIRRGVELLARELLRRRRLTAGEARGIVATALARAPAAERTPKSQARIHRGRARSGGARSR